MFCLAAELASCAVGPDFVRPTAPVSDGWNEKTNVASFDPKAAVDPNWWKTFNDPALDRLVELAVHQNLDVQVAGLRIVQARAQLGIVTGQIFPQQQELFGGAQAVGLSANTPNLPTGFSRHFGDFQGGFDAVWELDFWGKYRRGIEAQHNVLNASAEDYAQALVSLTAEVARTYVALRTFETLIKLAQQNVKVQEDGLSVAQARFHNGATSELDVSQATTLLETTRATIPPLELQRQQTRNALSTLLGQPSGWVDPMLDQPTEIPNAPIKIAVGVPAELLRRRPDVRSAELNAAAQCARIGVAKADLFPSFSLAGTVGLRAATAGVLTSNPINDLFYAVGPTIHWPFFNYGRLTNAVRVQDALFEQLVVTYRSTVLHAAQEVEDAMTGFTHWRDAVVASQRSVTAAERSSQLALIMYREGAVDYQRVLDAERSLLEQQNNLVQASSSLTTSAVALYKALGGGWEPRQGEPIVSPAVQEEMRQRTGWGGLLSPPQR
jgi:NodT family efflux transporter outer membrane factor (OMF) lipoprotein